MGGVGFWLGKKNLKTQTTYFKEWFQQGGPKAINNLFSTWINHFTFMGEVKTYGFYSLHSYNNGVNTWRCLGRIGCVLQLLN
jgi:hypothetical protein